MLCTFAVGIVWIIPAFGESVEHPLALAVVVVWTPVVFLALYYLLFGLRLLGCAKFPLGFRIPVGVDLFLSLLLLLLLLLGFGFVLFSALLVVFQT